jgi:tetratricopeptide (TPR) repeat protein
MKLPAFFILLTVVGVYPSPRLRDLNGPIASSPQASTSSQNSTSDSTGGSQGAPASPRQIAESRADLLSARKDYLGAAHAYEDLLKDDPRNAALLNKTGVVYQSLGDSELAERYYKRTLRVDKNSATALNNLGTVEYSSARYGQAIKYYRKAIDHDPKRATVYSNLGYAYSGERQYAKALAAFSKALVLDPEIYQRHGGGGPLIEQRSTNEPGMVFFLLAKSYAKIGDAAHTIQYLKLAGDGGYTNFAAAAKDADFAPVIENPQVREALHLPPLPHPDAGGGKTPS